MSKTPYTIEQMREQAIRVKYQKRTKLL